MKRVNIKDAFVGEPDSSQEGVEAEDSDEAVILAVRGGEIVAVVPAGTPDDSAVAAASTIRGALRLENERVLTFEIHEGASSAFFEDESAELHRRRQESGSVGLSTILGEDYMSGSRTAGQVMTRDVLTADPGMPMDELAKLLAFHNVSGMPVVDEAGKVVGVVSEADVIGKQGATVRDIMTPDVISVPEETSIEEIAALMAERKIKRVVVMDGELLLGMVSRADIVRALAARA
ncbi:MAG TPA: CBS domain-containing protein [Chloroflexota bacterium]|nr:CBS domain-containing protein [Chloroflexota bacterium]